MQWNVILILILGFNAERSFLLWTFIISFHNGIGKETIIPKSCWKMCIYGKVQLTDYTWVDIRSVLAWSLWRGYCIEWPDTRNKSWRKSLLMCAKSSNRITQNFWKRIYVKKLDWLLKSADVKSIVNVRDIVKS